MISQKRKELYKLTANQDYTIKSRAVKEQVSKLEKILHTHKVLQSKNKDSWAIVEELGYISQRLDEIFEMFSENPSYKKVL